MAYVLKFVMQSKSINGLIYNLDIYENGYTGAPYTLNPSESPFILNVLASSDDVMANIVSTELRVKIDVTNPYPAFLSLQNNDQFFTYGELSYLQGAAKNTLFKGFLIADAATTPFTTGFKEIEVTFTDGLSLLKNIPFVDSEGQAVNVKASLTGTMISIFNKLPFPTSFYLNVAVSFFCEDMQTRNDWSANEPFKQMLLPFNNWLTSDAANTYNNDAFVVSDFTNCYDILDRISQSFGCKIFQSNGQWHIASIFEMSQQQIWVTKYDSTGSVNASGQYNLQYNCKPYVSGTTDLYFLDNSQKKIYRNTPSQVFYKNVPKYSPNILGNGLLKWTSFGNPYRVNLYKNGTNATITYNAGSNTSYPSVDMTWLTGDAYVYAELIFNDQPWIYGYSGATWVLNFSFKIQYLTKKNTSNPSCIVRLEFFDAYGVKYYLNSKSQWAILPAPGDPTPADYYKVQGDGNVSISAQVPTGFFYLTTVAIRVCQYPVKTVESIKVSQFVMTLQNNVKYYASLNYGNTNNYNRIEKDVPYGGEPYFVKNTDNSQLWGLQWFMWDSPLTLYPSILALVAKQAYNILARPTINIDATFGNIYSVKQGETTPQHLQIFSNIVTQDDATAFDSCNGKKYLLGSCSINYIRDDVQGTLLEINGTEITGTTSNLTLLNPQ